MQDLASCMHLATEMIENEVSNVADCQWRHSSCRKFCGTVSHCWHLS